MMTNYTECLTICKDFHTSLSLAAALFPGIHHHQQAQTFKTKHKTDIKIIKQSPNILNGYVYRVCVPVTFRLIFLSLSRPGRARQGSRRALGTSFLHQIIRAPQHQAPFLPFRLRQSAVTTASSCRPPASQPQ